MVVKVKVTLDTSDFDRAKRELAELERRFIDGAGDTSGVPVGILAATAATAAGSTRRFSRRRLFGLKG